MTRTAAPATAVGVPAVLTKTACGLIGAGALLASAYAVFLLIIGAAEDGGDDSLAGLAVVIGAIVLAVALPVLGLCVAAVLSRRHVVVGACALLLAVSGGLLGTVSLLAEVTPEGVLALGAALGLGVTSTMTLRGPAQR